MKPIMRLGAFNVPGYDLKVNSNMEIKTDDLSGETSSTDKVSKGIKGKRLTVSLKIKYEDAQDLSRLRTVAEAIGDNEELKVYTIANATASAMGVRQVQFSDFRANEAETLKIWNVSFQLTERDSVAEKVEQRKMKPDNLVQTSEGEKIQDITEEEKAKEEEEKKQTAEAVVPPLTGFEKILSIVDKALA